MTAQAPAFLVVGRIGRPHGLGGELHVEVMTEFPEERFAPGSKLLVGPAGTSEPRPVTVVSSRPYRQGLLVRFDLAPDRNAAALLTHQWLFVRTCDARPLGEDAHYAHELEGMTVRTTEGRDLGRVTEVMETGSADVLVVSDGQREVLLPMIASVIVNIDSVQRCIEVSLLPGLVEEEQPPVRRRRPRASVP